jgi:hypothetical protein
VQRKRVTITFLAFCLAFQFAACGSYSDASRSTVKEDRDSPGEVQKVMIPKEIEKIPGRYFDKTNEPGTLTDLHYHTYESFSNNEKSKPLQKHAVVYLPYGYIPHGPMGALCCRSRRAKECLPLSTVITGSGCGTTWTARIVDGRLP